MPTSVPANAGTGAEGRKSLTRAATPRCCWFDQFDHPGADALRVQAQRLRPERVRPAAACRNKDHVLAALMIMPAPKLVGRALARPPTWLIVLGEPRVLGALLPAWALAVAAGPLLFFKAVMSDPPPPWPRAGRCRESHMIAAIDYRVRAQPDDRSQRYGRRRSSPLDKLV